VRLMTKCSDTPFADFGGGSAGGPVGAVVVWAVDEGEGKSKERKLRPSGSRTLAGSLPGE